MRPPQIRLLHAVGYLSAVAVLGALVPRQLNAESWSQYLLAFALVVLLGTSCLCALWVCGTSVTFLAELLRDYRKGRPR